MSAACWFADILEKEKAQQMGNVLCIADHKLKHQKADEKAAVGAKMPDRFNEKISKYPNGQK